MKPAFGVIVLGCTGGPAENNLSGYLLYPLQNPDALIALDAGSVLAGLNAAHQKQALSDFKLSYDSLTPVGEVFDKIKHYVISHAHLDHIAALVVNSQIQQPQKYILGLESTIEDLKTHVFNWVIWPNCANEGKEPYLSKYHYVRLPLHETVTIAQSSFTIQTHQLSHPHDYCSSAFLLCYEGQYVLYFGDTSPDAVEPSKHIEHIWRHIAPLIDAGTLKGIFLECSVPYEDSEQVIFGHLNSRLFMQEFHQLQKMTTKKLEGLKVIVTHRKESFSAWQDPKQLIADQLMQSNDLKLQLIFPSQGDKILL